MPRDDFLLIIAVSMAIHLTLTKEQKVNMIFLGHGRIRALAVSDSQLLQQCATIVAAINGTHAG